MRRGRQLVLIVATLGASWLGMQAVHELGHVLGAVMTGGRVGDVELPLIGISRTELVHNRHPLLVAWAGPGLGVALPVFLWGTAALAGLRVSFLLRFFAGFCLVANGLYLGVGSLSGAGDCGDLLRHGAAAWQLWLFGAVATTAGLWSWHGQGAHFGLGPSDGAIDSGAVAVSLASFAAVFGLFMSV